jgi:hypothetical protein
MNKCAADAADNQNEEDEWIETAKTVRRTPAGRCSENVCLPGHDRYDSPAAG